MSNGVDITKAGLAAKVEDEGLVIHVRGADGEPLYFGEARTPVTLRVAGTYSAVYRAALNRQRDRLVKLRRGKLSGELVEEQQLELQAACVLGWEGFTMNGIPTDCRPENVKQLLVAAPWVREQVEEAMNDHEGFTKSNSTPS